MTVGKLLIPDEWSIVASYLEGRDLRALWNTLQEADRSIVFRKLMQACDDKDTVITWHVINYGTVIRSYDCFWSHLPKLTVKHPDWFTKEQHAFVHRCSVDEQVLHDYSHESAETVRSLMVNPNLQNLFRDVIMLDARNVKKGDQILSAREQLAALSKPLDLRCFPNLEEIIAHHSGLTCEDIVVSRCVKATTDDRSRFINSYYRFILPANTPHPRLTSAVLRLKNCLDMI